MPDLSNLFLTLLPDIFALVMGLAIALYVILDGADLGIGMLTAVAPDHDKDTMVSVIGPFWDANETWLVLGVGLLLVAFPQAHGVVLQALYLPTAIMLLGLIMRGTAFEFRKKVVPTKKALWNGVFAFGSLLTALTQGYMLAMYIVGFREGLGSTIFAFITALSLAAGYMLPGACFLIAKTDGDLQKRAVQYARNALRAVVLGLGAVSVVTPLVSERIFHKWFSLPELFMVLPIPLLAAYLAYKLDRLLAQMPLPGDARASHPFFYTAGLFSTGFLGLAYSFYPYIVPEPHAMTIREAASAPEALIPLFIGAVIVLPCILGYTIYVYKIFSGKVRPEDSVY